MRAITWETGASVSPSDMPPNWYVIRSVMKSPMTSRIDTISRLSLMVGYCRCANRGTRRPEARSIARPIRIPSIGFPVISQYMNDEDPGQNIFQGVLTMTAHAATLFAMTTKFGQRSHEHITTATTRDLSRTKPPTLSILLWRRAGGFQRDGRVCSVIRTNMSRHCWANVPA